MLKAIFSNYPLIIPNKRRPHEHVIESFTLPLECIRKRDTDCTPIARGNSYPAEHTGVAEQKSRHYSLAIFPRDSNRTLSPGARQDNKFFGDRCIIRNEDTIFPRQIYNWSGRHKSCSRDPRDSFRCPVASECPPSIRDEYWAGKSGPRVGHCSV